MATSHPSLSSIIDQPFSFESLKDNLSASIAEAERISRSMTADRVSMYAFTQIMKYSIETLHPLALSVIIAHISDPEANHQLCYDAPLDKFRNPRAARLWAFLEILPTEYRRMIPDRIVEFWLRHPDSGVKEVGVQVARANRIGVSLKSPSEPIPEADAPPSLPPVPPLSLGPLAS